ncbi:MAG: hypothetical protein KBC33_03865 [Candidatus Pacebacteria bacterium]|nr:hypothetical protein [Candidatus Paceibacterota bacterium]
MERVRTTDYIVISLKGRSQGGGIPDDTANKALRKCYLQPGTPGKDLYEHAVPMDVHKEKIKLKTWREGGAGLRGKLVLEMSPTEEHRLDHGIVTNDVSMSGGSIHRIITLQGQYLFEVVIECKPVPDTSLPTAIPAVLTPSKSDEPLRFAAVKDPEDATLTDILGSAATTVERASVATAPIDAMIPPPQGIAVTTNTVKPAPSENIDGAVPMKPTETAPPRGRQPATTLKRTPRTRNETHMNTNQKPLIEWVLAEIANGLGTTVDKMLSRDVERKSVEADGRKLSVHALKDLIGIKPQTQLLPYFGNPDNNKNTGALFGIANKGKLLMKRAAYKKLIDGIVEKATTKFAGGETPSTPLKPAPVPSGPKGVLNGAIHSSAQDACIYTLFEAGGAADVVAAAFGISIDEVHTSLGRMIATNRPLIQKIRAAVKQTGL